MILLTGFVPFHNVAVNPSQLILEHIHHPDVVTRLLPTEYDAAGEQIAQLIDTLKPDAVLCLGVAQTRDAICLERVALNLDDASIPDNAGTQRSGQPIVDGAPLAYGSSLPLDTMRAAVAAKGIPVTFTNHAGTFVCNHVFYVARHTLETAARAIPCGFIHVPGLSETSEKGLPLETMVDAVNACLDVLRQHTAAQTTGAVTAADA